jgi:hypothetical protein
MDLSVENAKGDVVVSYALKISPTSGTSKTL